MTAKELRWVLVVSALILVFGSLPQAAGYLAQTEQQRFIGTFFDQQDYAVHLAMMHYGEQGGWGYQIIFTSEAHTLAHVRTFYVLLGHVAGWVHLPVQVIYEIARLSFGLLACLAIYYLFSRMLGSIAQRRLAFILALLGSGLGWLQLLLALVPSQVSPVDLWLLDAYPFFSFNLFPHRAAVIAAIALAVAAFIDHAHTPRLRNLLLITGCAIFTQFINPIVFILADLAMLGFFIYFCWQQKRLERRLALALGGIALAQVPISLYSYLLFANDPTWSIYSQQNLTPSPAPIYYLLGFGLFWPFAIAGAVQSLRQREPRLGWALTWVIGALLLAYLPFGIQRRSLLALTIPLAALSSAPLLQFSAWLGKRLRISRNSGAALITALACITSLILPIHYALGMSKTPPGLFEPAALVDAADFLAAHAAPGEVVVASEPTSLLIALRTGLRVYSGHELETIRYTEKSQAVQDFYAGRQAAGWLETQGIDWVIYGPHESQPRLEAQGLRAAQIVYQDGSVILLQVSAP